MPADVAPVDVAERVGFEPTDRVTTINALAGRPIRPLWHLSWGAAVYPGNLGGGTVAEWTIAAALKAAGRKARGFESLPFRRVMSTQHPAEAGYPRVVPDHPATVRIKPWIRGVGG